MKHLVVFTFSGEGGPLVEHAIREGVDATLAIIDNYNVILTDQEKFTPKSEDEDDKKRRMALQSGIVPVVTATKALVALTKVPEDEKQDYFLFFDMNYCFAFAEELRSLGFPGNYPTQEDRLFESDRDAGKKFVKQYYPGLKVAETHEFKTAEEGIAFLSESEDTWVLKGYDPDAITVVPNSDDVKKANQQLVDALEGRKELYEKAGYLLERKIRNAMEITPQGVWYNGDPVYYSVDIELKKKGAGETGPTVGCAANLILPLDENAPLVKIAFPPIVHQMAKAHTGMFVWDASILIDPATNELYYGEFCSNRCGYDSLYTEIEMSRGVKNYFDSIVSGVAPFPKTVYGFAFRSFNDHLDPDLPKRYQPGIEIGVDRDYLDHVWLMDAKKEDDKLVTCGYTGDLLVVTGRGETQYEAVSNAYDAHKEAISFEDVSYRPASDVLSNSYSSSVFVRHDKAQELGLLDVPEEVSTPLTDSGIYTRDLETGLRVRVVVRNGSVCVEPDAQNTI